MSKAERKLPTVMFTEIIGYDDLLGRNPPVAQLMLEKYREILQPRVLSRKGREIKAVGKELERTGLRGWVAGPQTKVGAQKLQSAESIVEFDNPLDATLCAIDLQRALREYNSGVQGKKEVLVRVGIHSGDVIYREGEIFGDAVNIASRIGPLAEPGGICVSEQIYDYIKDRTELEIAKLGPTRLKDVELPEVFRIVLPREKRGEGSTPHEERGRVAILPFANISAEPSDEYFADGMTEELISTMSKIRELSIISRTSVMQYKNKSKPISEIGRELKAGTILEGSVRKAGSRVRVTIQMIDAMKDKHLWVESYDREIQDIFAIQSDIAKRVTEALKVELLSNEKKDIGRSATESAEGYTLYLKGRYYWNERTKDGVDKAVKYFEEAVKVDPKYALAYAGLADCYLVYSDYGWLRPREAYPRAKDYAVEAIKIDPRIAEPHAALASVYSFYEYGWHEGEDEFKRTMELKPSYASAYHWYSLLLRFMGRLSEAYEQIQRASALDPLSRIIGLNVGVILLLMGKSKEAGEQFERVLEANPDYADAHRFLGWVYYLNSRIDEAISEMGKAVAFSGADPYRRADMACLLGLSGRHDEANRIVEELEELSRTSYVNEGDMALALLGAGRTDEAFSYLDKACEERSTRVLYLGDWPWLSEFRKDPRWASLQKRMRLR